MKISIMQPSYLPWLGYFELMAYTDLFVYLNDVQYTRKDWRSRNRVKTANKVVWLSAAVVRSPRETPINQIRLNYKEPWVKKHLRTIKLSDSRAPYFQPFFDDLSGVLNEQFEYLQDLNDALVRLCMKYLYIDCKLAWSSDLDITSLDKNDRIIKICKAFSASLLYDTKAAKAIIDSSLFATQGIEVVFQSYQHAEYPQLWGDFIPHLSAVDLIMNTGPEARRYLLHSPVPPQLKNKT
jgi:hypothetical protein